METFYYPFVRFDNETIPNAENLRTVIDFTKKDKTSKDFILVPFDVTEKLHSSWMSFFKDNKMCSIFNSKLKKLYQYGYENNFEVYPFPQDVLNFFQMDVDSINCVVVGQDPYPGFDSELKKPIANGYSFATHSQKIPMSQNAIREVITRKYGNISVKNPKLPYSLEGWIDQGVFLMNNTPVVYISKTPCDEKKKSQAKQIWSGISPAICKFIDSKRRCDFILFGSEASSLSASVTKSIQSVHMSGRSDRSDEFNFDASFGKARNIEWNMF